MQIRNSRADTRDRKERCRLVAVHAWRSVPTRSAGLARLDQLPRGLAAQAGFGKVFHLPHDNETSFRLTFASSTIVRLRPVDTQTPPILCGPRNGASMRRQEAADTFLSIRMTRNSPALGAPPMNRAVAGSLVTLVISTSLAWASGGIPTPSCAPTVLVPNVRLYLQPPPSLICGPTTAIPPPILYRAEVKPLVCAPAVPVPSVKLYRDKPPCVTLVTIKPPPVKFYRQEIKPVECLPTPPPRPSVTLYRQEVKPPECRPPVTIPNVTVHRQVPLSPTWASCPLATPNKCGEPRP